MQPSPPGSTVAPGPGPKSGQGRRLHPTELHEMRVAWGKKWGRMVSEAVKDLLAKEA